MMHIFIGKLAWSLSSSGAYYQLRLDIEWPRYYAALLEYDKQFGHCNVAPAENFTCILPGFREDGSDSKYTGPLGNWLRTQRKSLEKGTVLNKTLRPDREALLRKLVDQGMYILVSCYC